MFTGIVEGRIEVLDLIERDSDNKRIIFKSELENLKIGDSIAINGVCLTISSLDNDVFAMDILSETLEITNLKLVKPGDKLNYERALKVGDELGGHIVQGHVDGNLRLISLTEMGEDYRLTLELPEEFKSLVILKGSIALDGMSLTVAKIFNKRIVVFITPTTYAMTNLASKNYNDRINVEFDLVGKYINRSLSLNKNKVKNQKKPKSKSLLKFKVN